MATTVFLSVSRLSKSEMEKFLELKQFLDRLTTANQKPAER